MTESTKAWTALGLMSGTSMDGVDACLTRVSLSPGSFEFRIEDSSTVPFTDDERDAISRSLTGTADDVGTLHFRLGEAYARVADNFLNGRSVDLAGCHGQTVAHRDGNFTLQVGTPAHLSQAVKAPVVSSFRDADIAAGGNGAPLMPFLDWLLCRARSKATVVLNIGGVANISAISPGMDQAEVIGFDTGPGMGLIDETARLLFGSYCDQDGRYSTAGKVIPELLSELMAHPFIRRRPPKSTGRDEFGEVLVKQLADQFKVPPADMLRSVVSLTATSIAENIRRFVPFHDQVDTLIVSGGGVHHPILIEDLGNALPDWELATSQELGIDPDIKEALLIAVLAVARIQEIPANMPGVTGAGDTVVLGQITSG
ncbi:MAG: anhydro-N-acetylmuramic acid kinase [Fidelibacterota bacterium]|nr:MAG: anhydro-N-acetylmuramic acid kinase [Candidatus Neomarinimicrobiota bacterium]